jgi:hypothetical protein
MLCQSEVEVAMSVVLGLHELCTRAAATPSAEAPQSADVGAKLHKVRIASVIIQSSRR